MTGGQSMNIILAAPAFVPLWRICSVAALSLALLPSMADAQTSPAAPQKTETSPVKKSVDKKSAPDSRVEAKGKANQMATGIIAAEAALTPAELAIAERVYTGKLPCELGQSVTITPEAKTPGYFEVQLKNLKYLMFPVETTTGAIRLEDKKAGAVWLQLANKSMLMDQKAGKRLADACMNPAQTKVADDLEKNPGTTILDAPAPASTPSASASK